MREQLVEVGRFNYFGSCISSRDLVLVKCARAHAPLASTDFGCLASMLHPVIDRRSSVRISSDFGPAMRLRNIDVEHI